MSTVTERIPLADAIREAEAFRALFQSTIYQRWEFAGSVRRKRPDVADIEHVVIADHRIWNRMSLLLHAPGMLFDDPSMPLSKHIYPNGTPRFGDKYRGVDFNGRLHEIFCATPENFGCQLAIRTGPADYSRMLVTRMQDYGYRQSDGYLWRIDGDRRECVRCPDEATFFSAAGFPSVPAPETRK